MLNFVVFQGKFVYKKFDRIGEEGRFCVGFGVFIDIVGGRF